MNEEPRIARLHFAHQPFSPFLVPNHIVPLRHETETAWPLGIGNDAPSGTQDGKRHLYPQVS